VVVPTVLPLMRIFTFYVPFTSALAERLYSYWQPRTRKCGPLSDRSPQPKRHINVALQHKNGHFGQQFDSDSRQELPSLLGDLL
jgi:hypothetical protein